MTVSTRQPKTRRKATVKRPKNKTTAKNGHGKTQAVKQGGVYMLRPRRTPQALRRAKRLAALVRKELATVEQEITLDEMMRQLRGRSWSP